MTDLRTAAQQALEILERLHGGCTDSDDGTVEAITVWCPEIIKDLRAALAEPTGKDSLQVEPTVAENATTQQQIEDTPPSDYRRGYWDGFNIGKREGRIEAEDALAEPVQEPVAVALHTGTKQGIKWHREVEHGTPLYTAPSQRKQPLTDEEIQDCWQQRHRDKATERRLITRAIERAHGIGGTNESA